MTSPAQSSPAGSRPRWSAKMPLEVRGKLLERNCSIIVADRQHLGNREEREDFQTTIAERAALHVIEKRRCFSILKPLPLSFRRQAQHCRPWCKIALAI